MDKGIQLYRDSLVKILVVSGGLGKEGHYEGTKMFEYLIEKGIPKDKIIVDNLGNTTEETVLNFQKMNFRDNSITVVSQYYHITRTKLAFKRAGHDKVFGAHADYFEIRDVYSIFREFFAYYKYLFQYNDFE